MSVDPVDPEEHRFQPNSFLNKESAKWDTYWNPSDNNPAVFAGKFHKLWDHCRRHEAPSRMDPVVLDISMGKYRKTALGSDISLPNDLLSYPRIAKMAGSGSS